MPDHLYPVYEAFMALSRARPIVLAGMEAVAIHLPIPVSEACAAARAIGWSEMDFLRVIGTADEVWLARHNAR